MWSLFWLRNHQGQSHLHTTSPRGSGLGLAQALTFPTAPGWAPAWMVSWAVGPLHHSSCLNKRVLLTFWRSVAGGSICPSSLLELLILLPAGCAVLSATVDALLKHERTMHLFRFSGICLKYLILLKYRDVISITFVHEHFSIAKTENKTTKFELSFKWSITFNVLLAVESCLLDYVCLPFIYHLSTTTRKNMSSFPVYYSVSQKCFLLEDVKIQCIKEKIN